MQKVLIASSNLELGQEIAQFFSSEVNVQQAKNGEEAIDLYLDLNPDLIFLENNLVQPDSMEVIDYIRNTCNDQNVYIILLSIKSQTNFSLIKAGANDVLWLPLNKEELQIKLRIAKRQLTLVHNLNQAYRRIKKEIDLLSELQLKLLPKCNLDLENVKIQSYYKPSGQASGDYYDYLFVDKNKLRVCIADVSGHGAKASFIMSIVRTIFHFTKFNSFSLDAAVEMLNNYLVELLGSDVDFVTFFAAELNLKDKEMQYVNAGHCPIVVKKDGKVQHLKSEYPILGFFPLQIRSNKITYARKLDLLLYTDGFYEWDLEPGRQFGLENFLHLVDAYFARQEDLYLEELVSELNQVTEMPPMFRDDVTGLLLSCR